MALILRKSQLSPLYNRRVARYDLNKSNPYHHVLQRNL